MACSTLLAPSLEKVNFSRTIALLIDGGQLALRYQFNQIFPPSDLSNGLRKGKIRKILGDMKRMGKLNEEQWHVLYHPATGQEVSSDHFDISLLTCLLRNICNLKEPKTGWDNMPLPGDTSPEADIVRIRLLRNEMQHSSSASLSNPEFQQKWADIKQILIRLGNGIPDLTDSIDRLERDPWDPDKENEYQDLLMKWRDSDMMLRDIDQRTSMLESATRNLTNYVEKEMSNHNTAINTLQADQEKLEEKQRAGEYFQQHIEDKIEKMQLTCKDDKINMNEKMKHVDIRQEEMGKVIRRVESDIIYVKNELQGEGEKFTAMEIRQHEMEEDLKKIEFCATSTWREEKLKHDELSSVVANQSSQTKAIEEKVNDLVRRHDMDPVLQKMREKSIMWLSNIKKEKLHNFIKTHYLGQAINILKHSGVLVLSGGPGEGKTVTAAAVISYTSTPERCLVVRSPDDWKYIDPLAFDIIFIDNIFGEINLNIELINQWLPHLSDMWAMVRQKKTKFIIALRDHIFEKCRPKLQRANMFQPNFCLRLSSVDLSDQEKAQILEKYLISRNRKWPKDFISECVRNYSGLLGFPECAELFASHYALYIHGTEFFKKPLHFLKKCLDTLYGDSEEEFLPFAVMWIMQNRSQKVTREWLSSSDGVRSLLHNLNMQDVNSRSIEKSYASHSGRGGFITYIREDGSYDFGHAAVRDMVGMIMMREYPKFTLQECTFEFILEYLRVGNQTSDEMVYMVEPWLYSCLADRFIQHAIELLAKKYYDADMCFGWLAHEILQDKAFIAKFVNMLKERALIDKIFSFGTMMIQFVYSGNMFMKNISVFTYALCVPRSSDYSSTDSVINLQFAEYILCLGILDEISNKDFVTSQKTIALLFGLRSGKLSFVKTLIESGTVIDSNCLCMAVYRNYFDIVKLFIEEKDVDINDRAEMMNSSTALCIAAKTGNMDMLKYLIKKGASINVIDMHTVSPLGRAIMNRHEDIAETLIYHGANVFLKMSRLKKTALHLSADKGLVNTVKLLLKKGALTAGRDRRGHIPLHCAAMNGYGDIVNILLQYDRSQINNRAFSNSKKMRKRSGIKGVTALHYAARQGYVDVADILLQEGAEINIKDSFGQTPLYIASNFGHLDVVQLLVSRGAKVNSAENHGFTPLHVAVYRERTVVVNCLAKIATVDAADKYGKTPLHVACQRGYTDIVNILLAHSSNWRLGTFTDNTVLHYACRYGHVEITEEFTKRDIDMLQVNNSKTDHWDRKQPLMEALRFRRRQVVEKLKSMGIQMPYELPDEPVLSRRTIFDDLIKQLQLLSDEYQKMSD